MNFALEVVANKSETKKIILVTFIQIIKNLIKAGNIFKKQKIYIKNG